MEVEFLYEREDQEIPKNVTKLIIGEELVAIKESCCNEHGNLKEVDMSQAHVLETIEKSAFQACGTLEVFKCGPNVKTIDLFAFCGCKNLMEVDLSEMQALQSIGNRAFFGCTALRMFKCSPNIETIGSSAFEKCENLEQVDLSNMQVLESIGDNAFTGCKSLSVFKCPPNIKSKHLNMKQVLAHDYFPPEKVRNESDGCAAISDLKRIPIKNQQGMKKEFERIRNSLQRIHTFQSNANSLLQEVVNGEGTPRYFVILPLPQRSRS